MKTTYYLRNAKSAFLAICLLLCASHANADGTKDMYPQGSKGYRAAIWSSNDCKNTTNPFPTVGVMKVYAKTGEHVLLGSSAIGKGEGAIGFRAPNGESETFKTKEKGRIDTRAQELDGPNYNGTIPTGFTPIDIEVKDDQEGVWEIYFMSPTFSDTYNSDESTSKYSIENWSQNNNDGSIMAFDISVCDAGKTKLIPGRAYTNVLNMNVLQSPNGEKYGSCWYSNLYILTNVGYTYRVNTNGQNPHYGAFFSNNKGLQKVGTGKISTTNYIDPFSGKETGYKCYQDGEKSYKSMPSSLTETGYIYDPRMQDNRVKVANGKGDSTWKYEDVTHKIFFCQPANDLPENAKAVYGTTVSDTWLKTATTEKPKMDQLSLQGKEANTKGLFGPEGMQITFNSTVAGSFRIQMDFDGEYETKIFEGTCITGINRIDWDGKDGKGKNIAFDKDLTVKLRGELTTAEVHFPFTDLENNENGFILELIDKEGNAYSDVIYWDDSEVQANEEGTDGIQSLNGSASTTGAHKWTTSNSSGDDAIIDTWSYVKVNAESSTAIPAIRIVDLSVSNVKTEQQSAATGDTITVAMEIENIAKEGVEFDGSIIDLKNDADKAAVGIWVEEGGFHVTEIIINESDDENCVVLSQPNGEANAMGYISLHSGKKATISVKGFADEQLAGKTFTPKAYIMRPGDYFEIDAENLAEDGAPNNPMKEYSKENNNIVDCPAIKVSGNERPIISNTENSTLNVTIKGTNGTSYAEDPIMLPISIQDPEKTAVTSTLSGEDAANFKVENSNVYYIGTTPENGESSIYSFVISAKDEQGSTTERDVIVTLLMSDATLKPCEIAVKTDTIKYGEPLKSAIREMNTADTTSSGEANGTWVIRSDKGDETELNATPDAGVYDLTFSYYTTLLSDYESETQAQKVVVLPRTITLTSGSLEKTYDGSVFKNESITIDGDGFFESESVTANNFSTIQTVGEKENNFDITYSNGAKESNYNIEKKPGTLKVTPKELYVTGVKVNDKKFDGSTDAEVVEKGLLNGVVEGDEVEIESATAQFTSDTMGTDSAVVSFSLKGADAFNYIVKDTTVKASILNNDETNWIVNNPTLPYGEATVGVTEKATPNEPSEKAEITYTVDGVAANEGDIIPAGEHTIQVVYNDPESGKSIDTTFSCTVTKRPISIEGAKSEPKVFDGNNNATLADYGTIKGLIDGDVVNIDTEKTTATFDTPEVGTNKAVSIDYTLSGKDADNYEVKDLPVVINDGVITQADDNVDWILNNPTLPYGEATVGVTEKATPNEPNEKAEITYTVDGVAANEGDIIPAGEHTIQVVYNDPESGKSIDTTFSCIVTKRPISIEGAKSEPKVFDGNNNASLADYGTIKGLIDGDVVNIDTEKTTATFDTPEVGTDKAVIIDYTLSGKDADNYEVKESPVVINDGVITQADDNGGWIVNNPSLPYGEATVGVTEKATPNEPSEKAEITYTVDGVAANEGDIIPAGEHTIQVVYNDPESGKSIDTTFSCTVTKRPISIEGAKSEPKVFDGNNNASLADYGTIKGLIDGDEVNIDTEKTTATFDTPEVGTDKAVSIDYTLSGKDADNYEVKDLPVVINDGVITNADNNGNWIVNNPTLPYGEATVGVTEKATPNEPSEKAEITYTVDGVAANEGDIIPAGEHTIQVVYNDPESGKSIDTTFACIVTKRPISIEGAKSEPKVFDGNTQAKLTDKGTLVGVLKGDEVEIDQAKPTFETPNVGTNKNVTIQYTLAGNDLNNYEFTDNTIIINDGIITKADQTAPTVSSVITTGVEGGKISGLTDEMEISQDGITWTPVTDANATLPEGNYWVRYAETENANASSPTQVSVASGVIDMVDLERFIVDANGYCPESEGEIMFQVIAGNPTEFRASIVGVSEKKLENTAYQFLNEENKFSVYIPMCDAGSYTIQVQFRNEEGSVSPVYSFPINVNLAAKYINNIWEDVVSIINKNTPELDSKDFEKRFVEFQWYRDNEKIEGATMPYYNEKGGLNGVYYASVVTADNRHLRTCAREWHFTYGLTIDVYPNPVVDKANVTLSIDNGEEHELVVTNMSGVNIYRGLFTGDNTTIDCSSYGNGWYVIRVDNAQVKIIKE